MKRKLFVLAVICVCALSGIAFAGQGKGVMDGTGPQTRLLEGEPVEVSGVVASVQSNGVVVIDTGDEQLVPVYGLGPQWYWEAFEVSSPELNDPISIIGRELTFSDGSSKIVAFTVTLTVDDDVDVTIELRDSETGTPLWRQTRGKQQKQKFRYNCSREFNDNLL
ncbi:MAG: hypothetical protein ACMUJM_07390 [bacterium]